MAAPVAPVAGAVARRVGARALGALGAGGGGRRRGGRPGGEAVPGWVPEGPGTGGAATPPTHREGALDKAWKVDSAANLWNRAASLVAEYVIPTYHGNIRVSVVAGANGDIRRAWYLCLSAAFGRLKHTYGGGHTPLNFNTFQMTGKWDITRKIVSVDIMFVTSLYDNTDVQVASGSVVSGIVDKVGEGLTSIANTVGGLIGARPVVIGPGVRASVGVNPNRTPRSSVRRGPEQLTVGGTWPQWLTPTSGLAGFSDERTNPGAGNSPLSGHWDTLVERDENGVLVRNHPTRKKVVAVPYGSAGIFREYPIFTQSSFQIGDWKIFDGGVARSWPFRVQKQIWSDVEASFVGDPFATVNNNELFDLVDSGRVITTADKNDPRVQPPAPTLDGVGRNNLLALVAQSVTMPCFLPSAPPPAGALRPATYGAGVRLHNANADPSPAQMYALMAEAGKDNGGYEDFVGRRADGRAGSDQRSVPLIQGSPVVEPGGRP